MANNQRRMVYVKIWESGQFGKLSNEAKLLFIGMITLADDDGRLRADPAYLRAQIFPYNESMSVTETLRFRNEIEKNSLITVYSIDGFEYIEHPKWKEYQLIRNDLYKQSTLPKSNDDVTETLRKRPSKLSKVKLSKDKISKQPIRAKTPKTPNPLIDELISFLKEKRGIKDLDGSIKLNRRFAYLCLRKFKDVNIIKSMISSGTEHKFHRQNMTNFKYILNNGMKLVREDGGNLLWEK